DEVSAFVQGMQQRASSANPRRAAVGTAGASFQSFQRKDQPPATFLPSSEHRHSGIGSRRLRSKFKGASEQSGAFSRRGALCANGAQSSLTRSTTRACPGSKDCFSIKDLPISVYPGWSFASHYLSA